MREITLSQAVNEALAEEMRRDETVFIIGEDVAEAGTPFKVLSGLVEEFGTDARHRHADCRARLHGHCRRRGDDRFPSRGRPDVRRLHLPDHGPALQPGGQEHYMSGGKLTVPMVLRTNLGATRRSAAQHSQSLHALVAHIPA
jgi:pyruvate/2-oxoglutarate/acetoin dehydrogenase E1 component